MQYNSEANSQDLVSSIVSSTGVDATNDINYITRMANRANRFIWSWIFEAYGGWVYDDSNKTDLPTATASLVLDQSKYTLPSEALTIRGVEVKDEGGIWNKMILLPEERIRQFHSEEEFQDDSGQPLYYTPYAGLFKLHPAPNYAQATSLRISFDRDVTEFLVTDTTKEPGFVSTYHPAVSSGASYFIGIDKGLDNVNLLREEWGDMPEGVPDRGYKKAIKEFYSQRLVENGAPIIEQGRGRLTRDYI